VPHVDRRLAPRAYGPARTRRPRGTTVTPSNPSRSAVRVSEIPGPSQSSSAVRTDVSKVDDREDRRGRLRPRPLMGFASLGCAERESNRTQIVEPVQRVSSRACAYDPLDSGRRDRRDAGQRRRASCNTAAITPRVGCVEQRCPARSSLQHHTKGEHIAAPIERPASDLLRDMYESVRPAVPWSASTSASRPHRHRCRPARNAESST